MKKTRTVVTMAGLFLLAVTMSVAGARAQGMFHGVANGKFSLPFQVQWGKMTLPAGNYTFSLYEFASGGSLMIRVKGEKEGSPNGYVLTQGQDLTSASENELLCIHNAGNSIVSRLVLPSMHKSFRFALPRGEKLLTRRMNHNTRVQSAEASSTVQRVPVMMTSR